MSDWDTTDLRVESILTGAFVEAYGLDQPEEEEEDDDEHDPPASSRGT